MTFPIMFKSGQGLTEKEKSKALSIITQAKSLITSPASDADMAMLLSSLFGGLKATSVNSDAKAMASAYRFALDGVTFSVLKKAVMDILRGEAIGLSSTFLPSTPEVAEYCRKIVQATNVYISYLEKMISAPEEAKPLSITNPGRNEKIAALMAEFKQTQEQAA